MKKYVIMGIGFIVIVVASIIQMYLVYQEYGVISGYIFIPHWSLWLYAIGFALEIIALVIAFKES